MHPIVYYTFFFAIAGAAGMAVANRKATTTVGRQRWLKYFMYILITATVITCIGYGLFPWLALLITGLSFIELWINNTRKGSTRQVLWSCLLYCSIAAGFLWYAVAFNRPFLLFVYFQVLIFDGFCQVTGQLWGQRQLAPAVSPAKTVEGLAGGWACCIIAAMLAANWIHIPIAHAAFFGLLTGLFSFCGDIMASFYKRKLNIRDYSNWLPGQGGFLDRFDSLLFTGCMYGIIYVLIFKARFSEFVHV